MLDQKKKRGVNSEIKNNNFNLFVVDALWKYWFDK